MAPVKSSPELLAPCPFRSSYVKVTVLASPPVPGVSGSSGSGVGSSPPPSPGFSPPPAVSAFTPQITALYPDEVVVIVIVVGDVVAPEVISTSSIVAPYIIIFPSVKSNSSPFLYNFLLGSCISILYQPWRLYL
mgnify:CR=1 FL=1